MDRTVSIRFYSVEHPNGGGLGFSACLDQLNDLDLEERELEVADDIVLRLERYNPQPRYVIGEVLRRQSQNLPSRAPRGRSAQRLGVGSIGHSSVFLYDSNLSILAIQIGRNGITAGRFVKYVSSVLDVPEFQALPVIKRDAWELLQRSNLRSIQVKVASPEDLAAAEGAAGGVRDGLIALKEVARSAFVEATLGMSHGDRDLPRNRVMNILRYLVREKDEDRGGIKKVKARIVPDGEGQAEFLNILEAQMGDSRTLELPDDEPNASYDIRAEFITRTYRAHLNILRQQFEAQ
ncbi:MAG: DUF6731 family protein [Alphaproteobacteria bacterium]